MTKHLDLKNVSVSFSVPHEPAVKAVQNISFSCKQGEITGLIGESGSGKSVLGMAILGLLPNTAHVEGQIFYGQDDLLSYTENQVHALRGREISFIPQNPDSAFDPMQVVGKQIGEPLTISGMSKESVSTLVEKRLQEMGFTESHTVSTSYAFALSGGMCQRALCALGTIGNPSWLIADEPTKGLDVILRKQVVSTFRRLQEEGLSILLVTHDLDLAEHLCDALAVIKDGQLVEFGRKEQIFENPMEDYTKSLLAARPSQLCKRRCSRV